MPKPRKEENQDTLGQIFDFIFKEAEKPPDKRKPVKITGISGQNELTDALAAALEKPGVFMSDQILKTFDEALDFEVARITTREDGSAKVKFTLSGLPELLNDPNAYIEKGFKSAKAMRKQMRAQYMGKMMQHFVAEGWAKKYNLDLDAKEAIRGSFEAKHLDATLSTEERARSYDASNAIGALAEGSAVEVFSKGGKEHMGLGGLNLMSEKDHLMARSEELIGREVFGRAYWNKMGKDKREEFEKIRFEWSQIEKGKRSQQQNKIHSFFDNNFPTAYSSAFKRRYDNLKKNVFDDDDGKFEFWDRQKYAKLEDRNLEFRIKELEDYRNTNASTLSSMELANVDVGIQRLNQARVIVSGQMLTLDNVNRAKAQLNQSITSFKQRMEQARAAGNLDEAKLYKKELKNLKMGSRELNSILLWGKVGQIEGYINSFNGIYKEGAFVKSFLDGSFFNPDLNTLMRPSKKQDIYIDKGKISLWVADDSTNKLIKAYNTAVTPLYYLTPKSLLKTVFYNGEGFAYLALKIQKDLNDSLSKALQGAGSVDFTKLLSEDPEIYLASLVGAGNRAMIDKYLARMKRLKSMGQITKFFSLPQRLKEKMQKDLNDKIFRGIRRKIYMALKDRVSREARIVLAGWFAKGGIQTMVKGLVIALANALGFATTGGFANIVITVVASVLVDALYGIIKVIAMVVVFAFVGIFAIAFMLGSKSTTKYARNSYAYTTVVPGEVVTNPNFRGLYPIDDGEIPGELLPFNGGTLPDGVQCLLGAQSYRCNQGPYGSYSHSAVVAVDLGGVTTFYAPTFCGEGNCVVTTVMDVNCSYGGQSYYAGGMVIFTASYASTTYTFKLIHVYKSVSVGQKLSGGEAVADIITGADHSKISKCSSGPHLHLETKVGGASVNPMDVLTSPTSSGGFACNISACQ